MASSDPQQKQSWQDSLDGISEKLSGSKKAWVVTLAVALAVAVGVTAWTRFNPKQPAAQAKPADFSAVRSSQEQGVSDDEILLGMSAAFTGPSQELGKGMRAGIEACFEDVNAKGGIHGRKIRLIDLDDGYEPDRCLKAMQELVEVRKVFATIGNVGTPPATVSIPYTNEKKRIFFGAYTGAGILRKTPPDRYVFNFRASYEEETAAQVDFLVNVKKVRPDQIAVFAQADAYGDSGYNGAAKRIHALGGDGIKVLRVGYERNTDRVEAAVAEILQNRDKVKAIIMVPAYKPAAKFIKLLRDQKFDGTFCSVSFVNSGALAREFNDIGLEYADGVIVTQVVPFYGSIDDSINDYKECMNAYHRDQPLDFISLEGFVAARVFVAALEKNGPNLTTDSLITTIESIRGLRLGIGIEVSFSPADHQGSHQVWGTMLDASGEYRLISLR